VVEMSRAVGRGKSHSGRGTGTFRAHPARKTYCLYHRRSLQKASRLPGPPRHPAPLRNSQLRAAAGANIFSGQPFLALHLRRKDFLTDRCKQRHWVSACTATDKVAQCLAAEMDATGIPNLVLCSDAKGQEVRKDRFSKTAVFQAHCCCFLLLSVGKVWPRTATA